jgi:hypothetical protein
MRKLSEIKGEEALDVLAEIIEPAAEIFTDEAVKKALTEGKNKLEAVKVVLKNHKKAVIAVMAALEGVAVEEYQPPLLALPTMLMEVLNDPELQKLF